MTSEDIPEKLTGLRREYGNILYRDYILLLPTENQQGNFNRADTVIQSAKFMQSSERQMTHRTQTNPTLSRKIKKTNLTWTILKMSDLAGNMGGCPNYGPFWGTLNIRCRIIVGIQKGTIILTTTHMRSTVAVGLLAQKQETSINPKP